MSLITPVILSGGTGTRLWPLSRGETPKQLQRLVGNETMLQATARRTSSSTMFTPPIAVANRRHADIIDAQLADIGLSPSALILEPVGRNTAPAIAMAAMEAPDDALLLVLPSDHLVTDTAAFLAAIERGAAAAREDYLVTFGIRPTHPETGYGYIRQGAPLQPGAFRADRFVEKPDRQTAESYLADGGYHWNGGIFLFRADSVLEQLKRHEPDMLAGVRDALRDGDRRGHRLHPAEAPFSAISSRSIDHAVMEHADRVAVVPVDMGWSDVGSWDALYDIADKAGGTNAASGDVVAIDCDGCLLRSDGPTIVAVGVQDVVVVATKDAVLVVPRGDGQRVKEAVDLLTASGRSLV